jgi:hypothetical protein
LELFVFPAGIRLLTEKPSPYVHSFVLTMANGRRLYAFAYTKYAPVAKEILSVVRMVSDSIAVCSYCCALSLKELVARCAQQLANSMMAEDDPRSS